MLLLKSGDRLTVFATFNSYTESCREWVTYCSNVFTRQRPILNPGPRAYPNGCDRIAPSQYDHDLPCLPRMVRSALTAGRCSPARVGFASRVTPKYIHLSYKWTHNVVVNVKYSVLSLFRCTSNIMAIFSYQYVETTTTYLHFFVQFFLSIQFNKFQYSKFSLRKCHLFLLICFFFLFRRNYFRLSERDNFQSAKKIAPGFLSCIG